MGDFLGVWVEYMNPVALVREYDAVIRQDGVG